MSKRAKKSKRAKQGVIGERPGNTVDFDIPMMRACLADIEQEQR